MSALSDGTIRRLSLDVGQVNAAFASNPDPRAADIVRRSGVAEVYAQLDATAQIEQIGA